MGKRVPVSVLPDLFSTIGKIHRAVAEDGQLRKCFFITE